MRDVNKSKLLFELRDALKTIVAYVDLAQGCESVQIRQLLDLVVADVQLDQMWQVVEEARRELAQCVVREVEVRKLRALRKRRRRDGGDAIGI